MTKLAKLAQLLSRIEAPRRTLPLSDDEEFVVLERRDPDGDADDDWAAVAAKPRRLGELPRVSDVVRSVCALEWPGEAHSADDGRLEFCTASEQYEFRSPRSSVIARQFACAPGSQHLFALDLSAREKDPSSLTVYRLDHDGSSLTEYGELGELVAGLSTVAMAPTPAATPVDDTPPLPKRLHALATLVHQGATWSLAAVAGQDAIRVEAALEGGPLKSLTVVTPSELAMFRREVERR
jgi:hypothetical protein